ncbi:holin [Fictibacillus sp. Mic-4]|uniref:holin n=1 Tax=Fictibacillus TaxID=1329200 RepID=UPI0004111AC7|nr:holin [Fictibacillus gelatini]
MEQMLMFASLLTPLVTGLVELIKRTLTVKKKYIPLISFFIGIFVGIVAYPFTDLQTVLRMWSGGIAGLAATGLYELGKKTRTRRC